MYSSLLNVRLLVSMLKAKNINNIVISPGNSHNAIVRSIEEDGFFKTYNIVDERSAGFFALGLIQELNKPVAICCTAGTAASNYLTGVTEGMRRNLPLIIITADKNPYYLGQYEDQMIDQPSIFKNVTKYQCNLPIIHANDNKDKWYCNRVLNEAFLELNHHGSGPVHINVVIEEGMLAIDNYFNENNLPTINIINRYDIKTSKSVYKNIFNILKDKSILILCGQDDHLTENHKKLVETIFEKYNCIFATDKLSNLHSKGTLEISRAFICNKHDCNFLIPDVVISISGNTALDLKFSLKSFYQSFEHWIVNENGLVADPFRKLTKIFELTTEEFLENMANVDFKCTNHSYYDLWKTEDNLFKMPDFEFSNLYVTQKLMNNIPKNSNLNLGNSTTIRIAQYFDIDNSVQIYCNRGVNGIDGCVSTFIGQSTISQNKLNFLIVGDLTFFYDMNSLWNRYINKSIRIMLINNEGAALFHFNQGLEKFPTLNENVAAEHFANAKGWVESVGFEYISASTQEEFDILLPKFISNEIDKPIFFEIFTKKEIDAKLQHNFYNDVKKKNLVSDVKTGAKKVIKSVLGHDIVNKLRNKN